MQCGKPGFDPWVGKMPWIREFQCSGLENSRDYIVHGVTKSQTRLSNFHFHFFHGTGEVLRGWSQSCESAHIENLIYISVISDRDLTDPLT